jgi:hypothetical protein
MKREWNKNSGRVMRAILLLLALTALIIWGILAHRVSTHFERLLLEKERLQDAISRLTRDERVAYAKIVRREETSAGRAYRIRFLETAPDDPAEVFFRREFLVSDPTVYFDGLVVKFDDSWVMDGRARALLMWRRAFDEKTPPAAGVSLETKESFSGAYGDAFGSLFPGERAQFWNAVWSTAHDPDRLDALGIRAVFGEAVYTEMRPGILYVLRLTATGQIYVEAVPDL